MMVHIGKWTVKRQGSGGSTRLVNPGPDGEIQRYLGLIELTILFYVFMNRYCNLTASKCFTLLDI